MIINRELPGRFVYEDDEVVAFLTIEPIAPGHTLVVPKRHVASIYELSPGEQAALWATVAEARQRLQDQLHPDGFTIGVNDGVAAGQTVPHAHIHIIPRHNGDVSDPRGGVRWVIPDKARYW
jgi:diadenosine tetraphosphate (Ap4A) HIT family hydrolase